MLTILRHGNKFSVKNPVTGDWTKLVNVTFMEEGRDGAISSLTDSSNFLKTITGRDTGLKQVRVHTQPVKEEEIDHFPLGKQIEGHINRKLFSQPQMVQQESVQSRMIEGKPTFFTTYLDVQSKADIDLRMANETLAQVDPAQFTNIRTGTAERQVLELAVAQAINAEPVVEEPAGPATPVAATVGTETLAG